MINKKYSFDKSTINEIIRFHFKCLQGMYFSEFISHNTHVLLFSNLIDSSRYNFISLISKDINQVLLEVRSLFKIRNRQLALYVTPSSYLFGKENLIPSSFTHRATDAWMVLNKPKFLHTYNFSNNNSIEPVSFNERDLYTKTFISVYGGENPNGQHSKILKQFGQSLKQSFNTTPTGFNKVYIWAKLNDKPVGVASMISNKYYAGIYGLGTIEKYRNRGIGSSLMAFLVQKAINQNIQTIFLQTQNESKTEQWYKNIGFNTTFSAKYFVFE